MQYMRDTYGSKESSFVKYTHLRLTQQKTHSVDTYYSRFRKAVQCQTQSMKDPDDNFIYNFMFVERLDSKIQAELMRLSEATKMEELELNEVLTLAKRADQR